jgi:hypothetical protein
MSVLISPKLRDRAGEASVTGRYDISRRCGRSAWTITAFGW